jgi:hypothetical protein
VDSVFAVANPYAYAALTPLVAVDPDGNHPAWVVMAMGALAGASASSGIEVVSQLLDKGRVTQPGRVYAAAAGGAVAGAFTGGLGGVVAGTTGRVALGAGAGVVQVATTEVVRTKGKSAGSPGQLAVGAATGGAMVGLSVTVMRGASAPKPSFSGCNQMICWGDGTWKVNKGAGDAAPTGRSLGRGSTANLSKGTTLPRNLREALAVEQAMAAPGTGKQLPRVRMTDGRWPAEEGWVRMQQIVESGGREGPINVHYVQNTQTSAIDDFKIVLPGAR